MCVFPKDPGKQKLRGLLCNLVSCVNCWPATYLKLSSLPRTLPKLAVLGPEGFKQPSCRNLLLHVVHSCERSIFSGSGRALARVEGISNPALSDPRGLESNQLIRL